MVHYNFSFCVRLLLLFFSAFNNMFAFVLFGLFIRYAWILLVVFQLLMTNVSLLGHLCGILSGFACMLFLKFLLVISAVLLSLHDCGTMVSNFICTRIIFLVPDTYGLFNVLIPSTSFFSAIESSSWLVSNQNYSRMFSFLFSGIKTSVFFSLK